MSGKNLSEIIVNLTELTIAEEKMRKLMSGIGNRSFSVSFSSAKGDMADSLLELSQCLTELRAVLTTLYGNTADALASTRMSFDEMDNSIGNYFNVFLGEFNEK